MPHLARLISLNVAAARTLDWRGHAVQTGIFKEPVAGPRLATAEGLAGDRVVDRRYHGAEHQALYAYPSEHYAFWRAAFPGLILDWGAFGENLTTAGWDEDSVHVGDRIRIGEAQVEVTQPRWPCFKLGRKLRQPRIVKQLLESGKTGFYLRVVAPGLMEAGAALEPLSRDPQAMPVRTLLRLTLDAESAPEAMRWAADIRALAAPWREGLERRLAARPE